MVPAEYPVALYNEVTDTIQAALQSLKDVQVFDTQRGFVVSNGEEDIFVEII